MDLKSGCIFWREHDGPPPTFPPLDRDATCDIAIIGSGITGALVADSLSREGVDSVMLDRRQICTGSTPASTGLLQYEIDTPLTKLIELVGRDHAERAYRASVRSLSDFNDLLSDVEENDVLTPRTSLFLGYKRGDEKKLREECEARRHIGIEVELLSAADIQRDYGFKRPAALRSPRAFEADPLKLASILIRRSVRRGVRVFAETEVNGYAPDKTGVTLSTQNGPRVRAKKIVFATGYETPEFLDRSICQLKSTYALTSQPLQTFGNWRDRCLIWESASPYFYARTTPDNRVMIGGEDDDFVDPQRRDARIGKKSKQLVKKFGKLFPDLKIEPTCAWAGTFAETKDGLPYIGSTPEFPNGYFALGYGGNGITFSLIAAQIITDLFLERANSDSELFRFGR